MASTPPATLADAGAMPADVEALADQVPGARAHSPLDMPPSAWWAIIKRVYVMNGVHNLALLAAGVAFFAFLAFVPLIAVIVLLYGLIADPGTVANSLDLLNEVVPSEVLVIVREQLLQIVTTSSTQQGLGLVLALLFSTYGAMRAATAMMRALNIIYEEHETRGFFRTTLVAVMITLGMAGIAVVGLVSISLFSYVRNFVAPYIGASSLMLIQTLTWVVAAMLVSVTFAIFFRYAPDRRAAKWRWLSLGSMASTVLWLCITLGFGFYAANVSDYNATYGSLAAIVIFLMWLFLSAYAVLIGAEINAETERQTFRDSTVGADRPLGQRGAALADSVALDEAEQAILEKQRRRRTVQP
ncbi:YihY family inner membrane domain protein [Blastomonas sp. RAC04]|uniref:YihY/virulence factor BrkB family protein n=1 Tax=Blastomonas sp. RAC04 TaxID=1842535 RepID=UPI00085722FB|nr:YihY/virulence factor BrkB family protein [Blastomonas sp. RAC04]AOF99480.1 YihY family inner membrane domain protein [Blastomonas sp. RAC04]